MVGVKTNIVTSVEVTDGYANDMPRLPALVGTTGSRFQIAEVSADKGYQQQAELGGGSQCRSSPLHSV